MLFERLEIENFASYYGVHSINLEITPEKPVIIFIGGTGHGKTSIFDAINWSLYGGEYERDLIKRRQRKIEDYLNQKALREAFENNTSTEMSCTLYFEHDNVHYYISQSLCIKPKRNTFGNLVPIQTDRITSLYKVTHRGDHVPLVYDTIFLDEILPSNVKDYFLFDGDRIYQLSNPGSSQQVRDAIYRVVDLELLQNAQEHISQIAAEYRKEAKKQSTGELSSIESDYNESHEKLARFKKTLSDYKQEDHAIRDQIDILEQKLSELPDTSKLQARRTEIERQLKQTEGQIEEKVSNIRKNLTSAALALAREPMMSLITDLDTKRKKGQIPRNISKSLLIDLISLKTCLCGTEFTEGDQIFINLNKRLIEESKRSSGQEFIELFYQVKHTNENTNDSILRLKELNKEHNYLSNSYQELNIALKQVDNDLEKLPKEDIGIITNELRDRRNALVTITRNITLLTVRIEECDTNIRSLEKKRVELGKKQKEYIHLQRRETLAQSAASHLEDIYEKFAEESRKAIEELTRKEFKNFAETAEAYEVALDENYELLVLDPNGNKALQRLSMGQSQCLSLSFITAISRVSEKAPPLVIDMPFGRLDPDVHNTVSKRLPELTSQLILFLIPQVEWNEVTSKNLRPKSNQIYQLSFDKENQLTEINNIMQGS